MSQPLFSLSPLLTAPPLPYPSTPPSEKSRPPRDNQVRQGSSHTEAGQDSVCNRREKVPRAGKSQIHSLPRLGVPQKHWANGRAYTEDLLQTQASPVHAASVSEPI